MSFRRFAIPYTIALVIAFACVPLPANAQSHAKEKTIFDLGGGAQGNGMYAGVIFDQAGNIYSTTGLGGAHKNGTVFKLSRTGKGIQETVIHNFRGGADGSQPRAALVMDSSGNLYGTTLLGGPANEGVVFELTPGKGTWTETVLHTFTGAPDGSQPYAGLLMGAGGVLFGTTSGGGAKGRGTVFRLAPSSGGWTESVLYSFTGKGDGGSPRGGLIADAGGNLYGTTAGGGVAGCDIAAFGKGCGTVFELSSVNGGWQETVLYSFTGTAGDGANSVAALLFDGSGNLYGTTQYGGTGACLYQGATAGCGTVFELSPIGAAWQEKALYAFTSNSADDGAEPVAPLVFDSAGNLYGTTAGGGNGFDRSAFGGDGTVFELSPVNGTWQEAVLHYFDGNDGARPTGGLTFNSHGNLFGTTVTAGFDFGVVFGLRP
jgi:uncharacterized repeat protein (TIGR03803 family)